MRLSLKIIPYVLLSLLALLTGLWAGLQRIGWSLPGDNIPIMVSHGTLMISGFLGTLISLERVVALRKRWMLAAPLLSGTGWLITLFLPTMMIGPVLISLASLVAVLILLVIVRRDTKIYTITMAIGMVGWMIGNIYWLFGAPTFQSVPWWAAFLILTIAGERLELSRVLRITTVQYRLFSGAVLIYLVGVILTGLLPDVGWRILGIGLLLLSAWLVRFDLARRNLRHPAPLTRYIAYCLFLGYIWLGASGILSLWFGLQTAGFYYDAILHTVFIGFVLSMIFGHAPIILPALINVMLPFRKYFYIHLILLHGSLAIRITGDLIPSFQLRRWGGLLNEVAVLLFLSVTTSVMVRATKRRK